MAKKKKEQEQQNMPDRTSEQLAEGDEEAIGNKLRDLEEKLADTETKLTESEKKCEEMNNSILRLRADFENYRRRNSTLRSDSITDGRIEVISGILKTLDNFERALATECSDEGYASGMQMIFNMMKSTLSDMGLEEIDTETAFDPNFHEAVMQEEEDGKESGSITAVLQKGYMLNGKVIRPAMVKVAK